MNKVPNGKNPSKELLDVFDDLASRFIINLPEEELESPERICFHIEAALWYYDDFYREQNPKFPSFNLKEFTRIMFTNCPLLRPHLESTSIEDIIAAFTHYKVRVPVCGAIILSPDMTKVLLVKGWSNRSSWGFPKGKINQNEPEGECAIREVDEETSYDIRPLLKEEDSLELEIREQKIKMYIITGVPEDAKFAPKTRKEISKIEWIPIAELPSSYIKDAPGSGNWTVNTWSVVPFVNKLKQWILKKKRHNKRDTRTPRRDRSASKSDQNQNLLNGQLKRPIVKQEAEAGPISQEPSVNLLSKLSSAINAFNGNPVTNVQPVPSILQNILPPPQHHVPAPMQLVPSLESLKKKQIEHKHPVYQDPSIAFASPPRIPYAQPNSLVSPPPRLIMDPARLSFTNTEKPHRQVQKRLFADDVTPSTSSSSSWDNFKFDQSEIMKQLMSGFVIVNEPVM